MTTEEKVEQEIARIISLINEAVACNNEGRFMRALKAVDKALKLLPEPHADYELSVIIYAARGDTFFNMQDYSEALKNYFSAYNAAGGTYSAYINMRLGMAFYELNKKTKASEYLSRAFVQDIQVFNGFDQKYIDFVMESVKEYEVAI